MDGLEMFWGGAPKPLNEDVEIRGEFELTRDLDDEAVSEPEYYNPQTGEGAAAKQRAAPDLAKSLRVPGGLAATSKKITADYDSDDGRIIELKQQGYSDEYVAEKLQQEGRIRYVGKTVGSRWLRLRKVLEDREDERLDDELSDWHIGEDEMITNIKAEVEKKYETKYQQLQEKKWREVSIYLADKLGKRKYTAKACEERFEAIKAGTALLPIEIDDDQAGRRQMREQRIAKAKADRAANEEAVRITAELKKAKQEARKRAREEMVAKREEETTRKNQERKERNRIKREREIIRQKLKDARVIRLAEMRAQRDWQMEKWRGEKTLYKNFTGKNMPGQGGAAVRQRKTNDGCDTDEEDELDDTELTEESDAQMTGEGDGGDEGSEPGTSRADSALPIRIKKSTNDRRRVNPARNARGKGKGKAPAAPVMPATVDGGFNKAPVTKETLLNPRSIMNLEELDACLFSRKLPLRHPTESHAEVVSRLVHADNDLTVPDLNELLRAALEPISGKKDAKVQRLAAAEAAHSVKGSAGLISTELEFMRDYEGYQGEFAYLLDEAEAAASEM
ncbi:hypothetical protein AC579_8680 [Pseudocercospora musae]|uniref:DUF7626 domain-containing protein n=1 Tax=Pseudocercospora musae TaxID=113226 RepID=A0A139I0E4_9PEZI|nr:hypothetical protein AC579_8680 [Pseudocercospora musae]